MTTPLPDYGISFVEDQLQKTLTAEEYAETFMKQQISDPNYNHQLNASQLWAIKSDDTYHLLDVHPDVYDLLESEYNLNSYKGIVIHTTGWAAPLNEDGSVSTAPSQHIERRRVALATCVTDASSGSALSFSDSKEIILDPGSATGSLAESLLKFWELNRTSM